MKSVTVYAVIGPSKSESEIEKYQIAATKTTTEVAECHPRRLKRMVAAI
jgi:hypothetical protein